MINHTQIVIHSNANQIWNMLRRQTHDKHNKHNKQQQEEKTSANRLNGTTKTDPNVTST